MEITLDENVQIMESNESSELVTQIGPSSPFKVLSNKENVTSMSVPSQNSKNKCAICSIEYGSEADIVSHWMQCSRSCGYWVHSTCCGIMYPPDAAGLRALNKWANGRFFCPKHMKLS